VRALLAAGPSYRCQIGDRLHLEVETLDVRRRFGGHPWVGKAGD
jgi:hypothetical protein